MGAAASLPIAGLSLAFGQGDDVQNAMMGVVGHDFERDAERGQSE